MLFTGALLQGLLRGFTSKMTRLYSLVQEAVRKCAGSAGIGLCIVQSVLSNRKDRDDIYRRGEKRNFRNKEFSRIVSGLEQLVRSENLNIDAKRLASDANLMEYRDIFALNFVYDALKCSFQYCKDLDESAALLGDSVLALSRKWYGKSNYKKSGITDTQAYNELLVNLKNQIRKKYHIILDSNI